MQIHIFSTNRLHPHSPYRNYSEFESLNLYILGMMFKLKLKISKLWENPIINLMES